MVFSFLLGLIVLIRPVNGYVLFSLPFLAGSSGNLKSAVRSLLNHKTSLLIGFILFILTISIQLTIYKFSTGSFFLYSYVGEGFQFLHPHMIDFLFSYKKGALLYTPLLLVALSGLIPLFRMNRFSFSCQIGRAHV